MLPFLNLNLKKKIEKKTSRGEAETKSGDKIHRGG